MHSNHNLYDINTQIVGRFMKSLMVTALAVGLCVSGVESSAQVTPDPVRVFEARDVFELEYAADPRIAPDGLSIVYVRRSNDIMTDKTRSNIWQVSVDGRQHRPLLSSRENFSSPRWSPSGDRLAYISSVEGSSQVYLRWMDSGQTALLTNVAKTPSAVSWSRDGKWLAFTMNVPAKKKTIVKARVKPEGATWAEPVRVIDTVRYQFDGRGIVAPEYRHVFILPADGGTPRQLTRGEFNHEGPLSWSQDSTHILFHANRHPDWELQSVESDIYSIHIVTRQMTRITESPGAESNALYSPDGKLIAYVRAENKSLAYRTSRLAIMNANGSGQKILSGNLDSSVSNIRWSGNGRSIYVQYDERAERKVARITLQGVIETVASGLGGTGLGRPYLSGSYDVSVNDVIAFTRGLDSRPADISVVLKNRKSRHLTDLNSDLLADLKLAQIRELIYHSSFDNQEIQGWYLTPPNFDSSKQYPLILEIHGGPHAAYGPYFSAELQLMAAAGYVVFYDNYRGSTSYGEKFALLLQYKYASKEDFADHMSGVDAMIDKGFIDKDNLFITGGSAGGIATAYAVGLTNRFNAAVAAKPVINWISKTLTADSSVRQIRHQFPGMPWENFEHYWQRSPLSLVGNVTTPTMLITGENDRRTPISETEQFYQALKLLKVDTVMIRVPGSPHGIAGRPSRLVAKVDNILAWFKRYRTDLEG